jgi:hypothetical protein
MENKKPGNPFQDNRVKIISYFLQRSRTHWDVPKLKFGSSDWDRLSQQVANK